MLTKMMMMVGGIESGSQVAIECVVLRWLPQSCLCVRMAQVMGAEVMEVGAVRWIGHGVWVEHVSAIAAGSEATLRRWRNGWAIYVQAGVLFLPFCATVLEPDFYLHGKKKNQFIKTSSF